MEYNGSAETATDAEKGLQFLTYTWHMEGDSKLRSACDLKVEGSWYYRFINVKVVSCIIRINTLAQNITMELRLYIPLRSTAVTIMRPAAIRSATVIAIAAGSSSLSDNVSLPPIHRIIKPY